MSSKVFNATQHTSDGPGPVSDLLPVEAVLQLKVNGIAYTTTVRTPGADEALARGLLFTEGVLIDPVIKPVFRHVRDPDSGHTGCLEITVPEAALAKDIGGRRSSMTSASCGFCGIREPDEISMTGSAVLSPPARRLDVATLQSLVAQLGDYQPLFAETGGVHGALAFAADGTVLCAHEDIGRHNAVDKVIGDLLIQGRLNVAVGVVVSGRLSYEIVFKAYQAKWPYLLAVSAPSSLAVEMGERFGMAVVGFCRDGRATVYSRPGLLVGERV